MSGWVRHLQRGWGAASLALLLGACGGGGGGSPSEPAFSAAPSGPPAGAAAVGITEADAVQATRVVVGAADDMVATKGSAAGLVALTGVAVVGNAQPSPFGFVPSSRPRALAVTTEACDIFLDPPCTGTVRMDTPIAQNATRAQRGQYLDATFSGISGSLLGQPLSLSGGLRVEFLTDFDASAPTLVGIGLRLKFTAFSGNLAGQSFGPLSQTADLTYSAQGVPTLVTAGARYGELSGVTVTGSGSYLIQPGVARVAYGPSTAGYVDVGLGIWRVNAGRPAAGSVATLDVPGLNVFISVASSSSTSVVYDVSITSATPGSTRRWTVTAQYPQGGGAPVYSVVPAG